MSIFAIDIGTRSLGWASWSVSRDTLRFGVADLCAGVPKKKHTDYAYLVRRFIDNCTFIRSATIVLIERQISSKMKQVAMAFRCFCWNRMPLIISPITVKRFFRTSTGVYALNKSAAIVKVRDYLTREQRVHFAVLRKKAQSDVADAVLMVVYYAVKNKLTKTWRQHPVDPKPPRPVVS